MTLAETQALFHRLLARGPGSDPERLLCCFAGTEALPAPERVGIYADMFLWRQVEALREELPRLAGLLGEEPFLALCRAYLDEHPSEHHDIGRLGRRMADFLARRPGGRPDLAALAELEWARSEAFFAPAAGSAGPEAFAAVPAADFPRARLRLSPSVRLLRQDWDGAALWRALEAGEEAGPPAPGPAAALVWRPAFQVLHASVGLDEAAALEAALAGEPLAMVCAAFERTEDPGAAAHAALSSWIEEGLVSAVEPPGAEPER